jgi:hypothetical protein
MTVLGSVSTIGGRFTSTGVFGGRLELQHSGGRLRDGARRDDPFDRLSRDRRDQLEIVVVVQNDKP